MITNKYKPFKIPKLTEEHPLYARALAPWIEGVERLPDFNGDNTLYLLSDFGGEHKGAGFRTYSFLILSKDKNAIFETESKKLRTEFGLNVSEPFKEFSLKEFSNGQIAGALPELLKLADSCIHGVLFTLAIDSKLDTVFDVSKNKSYAKLIKGLEENNLGVWKGKEAEKLLRICNILAMFMSLLSRDGHNFLWICDHDSINEDGNSRDFSHTQEVFFTR